MCSREAGKKLAGEFFSLPPLGFSLVIPLMPLESMYEKCLDVDDDVGEGRGQKFLT
jgi:hypothetical protein